MTNKYHYLQKFRFKDRSSMTSDEKRLRTWFHRVDASAIKKAEDIMGVSFPDEMHEFFLSVGAGFLGASIYNPYAIDDSSVNRFFSPLDVADMYKKKSHLFGGPDLRPDQLPLMETLSEDYVIILRNKPGCPVCLRGSGKHIVEDSLEKFVHGLAHIGPDYYSDRVDRQLAKKSRRK